MNRVDHTKDSPCPPVISKRISTGANIQGSGPKVPVGTYGRQIVAYWNGGLCNVVLGTDGNIYAVGKDIIGDPQSVYLLIEGATEEDRRFYAR